MHGDDGCNPLVGEVLWVYWRASGGHHWTGHRQNSTTRDIDRDVRVTVDLDAKRLSLLACKPGSQRQRKTKSTFL